MRFPTHLITLGRKCVARSRFLLCWRRLGKQASLGRTRCREHMLFLRRWVFGGHNYLLFLSSAEIIYMFLFPLHAASIPNLVSYHLLDFTELLHDTSLFGSLELFAKLLLEPLQLIYSHSPVFGFHRYKECGRKFNWTQDTFMELDTERSPLHQNHRNDV